MILMPPGLRPWNTMAVDAVACAHDVRPAAAEIIDPWEAVLAAFRDVAAGLPRSVAVAAD
jgi:hypothetical protein